MTVRLGVGGGVRGSEKQMTGAAEDFRRDLGELLAALRRSDSWLLTEEEGSGEGAFRVHAGACGSVSWYQRTSNGPSPVVYVSDDMALIQDYLAIASIGWQGSLTRLEKVMGGAGWVRVPVGDVISRDPGVLPEVWAAESISLPGGKGITVLDVESGVRRYRAHDEYGRPSVWTFSTDQPGLSITWSYGWTKLDFPGVACPFPVPDGAEVMDAETVLAMGKLSQRIKRPRRPAGYSVQIEESEGDDERYPWTLRDPDLADALGEPDCIAAQDAVRCALVASSRKLSREVVFDSEMGCFFAYARTVTDAERLAQLIADVVQQRQSARYS